MMFTHSTQSRAAGHTSMQIFLMNLSWLERAVQAKFVLVASFQHSNAAARRQHTQHDGMPESIAVRGLNSVQKESVQNNMLRIKMASDVNSDITNCSCRYKNVARRGPRILSGAPDNLSAQ